MGASSAAARGGSSWRSRRSTRKRCGARARGVREVAGVGAPGPRGRELGRGLLAEDREAAARFAEVVEPEVEDRDLPGAERIDQLAAP
jgi:hypothetical protein